MGTSSPTLVKQYGYKGGKLLVTAEGATLKWLVTDHLGSTRMELNSAGSIDKRHDYLPFGEELLAGTVRSAANAYEPPLSNTRQRFGTYERDNETGLDFAQARYYSSVQGRFTSPDSVSGAIGNPQTLNLYSYVMGNPLRYSDPTGHYASDKTSPEEREQERMRRRELDLARLKCGVCNLEYKGWRIVPGTNPGGKPIINFRWVNDPKVHDVPNDHRYVDTEGRVIQLYGDDKTNNHGWGVHKAGPDPVVSDQTSDPPSQFRKYGDLRAALIKNGYQGFYDPHPDHIGGYNFSQPLSPTFNITIFTKEGRGFAGYNDTIDHMDAHVELYSPINNRVKHITKETVPNAWGRFKKWVWQ
jgi:RHS repeat-associated protein